MCRVSVFLVEVVRVCALAGFALQCMTQEQAARVRACNSNRSP